MKNNGFVADGSRRLWQGKKTLASESVEQKYATELAKANPDEKGKIQKQMAAELSWREKALNHKPAAGTFW